MIRTLLPALLLICFFQASNAQLCDTSASTCIPANTLTTPGLTSYNQFPCVENGKSYTYSFELYIPTALSVGGTSVSITAISIDSINNLPCGLCWRCNKSSRYYLGGEHGCITISGVSNDLTGTYKLDLFGTALTNFGVFSSQLDYPGFQAYLRVIDSNQTCSTFDTINTKRACSLNTSCTIDGVEILQLNNPNHCLINGDSIILGINFPLSSYTWYITDYLGNTITETSSTVSIPYNGYRRIDFTGTLGNCSFTIPSYSYSIDNGGLKCPPKFCYIEADTFQNNNRAHFYFQKNNTSNNMISSYTPSKVYNNGTSTQVFLDTIMANQLGQFEDSIIDDAQYTIYVNSSACDNSLGEVYMNLLNVGYFGLVNDVNGYPVLSIKMPNLDISTFSVFKRPLGGNWTLLRTYYSVANAVILGDNSPTSTSMEYQITYQVNAACNPSRSSSEHIYSRKSITVPSSVVVSGTYDLLLDHWSVSPNPSKGLFRINGDQNVKSLIVEVLDYTGRLVQKNEDFILSNNIDLRPLNDGIYFVRISTGNKSKQFKLVKM